MMEKELVEFWRRCKEAVNVTDPVSLTGRVKKVVGLIIEAQGPQGEIGEVCRILPRNGSDSSVAAEIVGFRGKTVLLMPLGEMHGIGPGCEVIKTGGRLHADVGPAHLGRVLDGLGNPIDDKEGDPADHPKCRSYAVHKDPPGPMERERIDEILPVGIKAIDGMLSCGKGQRLGIFAGSGVGKSVLMGMIARNTAAEVNVIALIGERGREVRDFVEKDLGEGLERSVVVAATSDQPALVRIKAAYLATALAEYFRDQGKDVMLMMDSITRFARAQREVGLATGEPPATRGFPPSVFAKLPKLLERPGKTKRGTITAFYTVLVDGDDFNEPITDEVRSIVDGHIVLKRELADKGHYPAIDVLGSVSRVMPDIVTDEHMKAAQEVEAAIATYRESEDLINIGAYREGNNPRLDVAVKYMPEIEDFLTQEIDESVDHGEALRQIFDLATRIRNENDNLR